MDIASEKEIETPAQESLFSNPRDMYPWLKLIHAPGIGAARFAEILTHYPDPASALDDLLAACKGRYVNADVINYLKQATHPEVEADLAWADQKGHYLITLHDARYPPQLKAISAAPPILYVIGDPDVLRLAQLAIVGSRNPTPGGIETTKHFASQLGQAGIIISSGLALGIDANAHEATLRSGGITLAVIGTGPDRVYPARHKKLAHHIVEQGAIVSEFCVGTEPKAENFPRRNRVLSGLSLGTLVVEAGLRSGSLITARLAAEQGREVFAIPGSIYNPMSRGCHQLIRQGAKLVETTQDILEELAPLLAIHGHTSTLPEEVTAKTDTLMTNIAKSSKQHASSSPAVANDTESVENLDIHVAHQKLLDFMGYDPVSLDVLVKRSGLTVEAISSMLTIMELQGQVASSSGGLYVRLKPGIRSQ